MHKVSQLVLELLFVAFILGFCWVSNCWLKLFLLIQKAAGTVLTGGFRRDPVCPVLASLQWLPVKFGIQFKILLTTSKALTGFAPSYIKDILAPHNRTWTLGSVTKGLLVAGLKCEVELLLSGSSPVEPAAGLRTKRQQPLCFKTQASD